VCHQGNKSRENFIHFFKGLQLVKVWAFASATQAATAAVIPFSIVIMQGKMKALTEHQEMDHYMQFPSQGKA
jgi:hypothetical protein